MSVEWSSLAALPFGTVGGEEISLADALRMLKLDFSEEPRRPSDWTRVVVERVVVQQTASALELAPSDEELQGLMKEFRQERGLHSVAATEAFLEGRGLTLDDFAEALELIWQERALRRRHAEDPAERYFLQHSPEYDTALLSELTAPDEDLVRELGLQLREEGADFASLVRRYSTGASRSTAGFLGEVRRAALRGREAAAVFGAEADTVVGPFPHERQFRLLRVHEVHRAVFTDAVRRQIESRLWSEWLSLAVRAAQAEVGVLGHL